MLIFDKKDRFHTLSKLKGYDSPQPLRIKFGLGSVVNTDVYVGNVPFLTSEKISNGLCIFDLIVKYFSCIARSTYTVSKRSSWLQVVKTNLGYHSNFLEVNFIRISGILIFPLLNSQKYFISTVSNICFYSSSQLYFTFTSITKIKGWAFAVNSQNSPSQIILSVSVSNLPETFLLLGEQSPLGHSGSTSVQSYISFLPENFVDP